MAVAAELTQAGFTPDRIHTTAKVHLEKRPDGFAIPLIELETEASVPNLTPEQFEQYAQTAKKGCPVSKALTGVEIRLNAKLT